MMSKIEKEKNEKKSLNFGQIWWFGNFFLIVGNTENRRLRRRRGQASSNSGRHTENNSPWQKSPSCVKKKQKCHKNTFTKTIVFFWHTKGLYRTKLCCIPFSKEIIIFVTSLFFFLGNQKVNCKVAFLVYCKSW